MQSFRVFWELHIEVNQEPMPSRMLLGICLRNVSWKKNFPIKGHNILKLILIKDCGIKAYQGGEQLYMYTSKHLVWRMYWGKQSVVGGIDIGQYVAVHIRRVTWCYVSSLVSFSSQHFVPRSENFAFFAFRHWTYTIPVTSGRHYLE